MTEQRKKRRRLIFEILCMVALCFALSLILFAVSVTVGRALIEEYCFNNDVSLDDGDWYHLEQVLLGAGFVLSALVFSGLFLALFSERLAYIGKIIRGVHALRAGDFSHRVRLAGNNELTELAEAVNYLAESEQRLREKEKRFNEEREELIRTLSHDIRTPLTSVTSYTDLLAGKESLTEEEIRAYLSLVGKKTAQIRELTDLLLDGGRREIERFEDARLLFAQLAAEFEEALEESFRLSVTLPSEAPFPGSFDVGGLRRIFDNLISNIQKYADPAGTVALSVSRTDAGLLIRQSNDVRRETPPAESYRMGLNSIRRIAQGYGGTVEVSEAEGRFEIRILLSRI